MERLEKIKVEKIKEYERRISNLKRQIRELNKRYLKEFSPKGYGHGTSYNDYDIIHGSKEEPRIEEYYKEKERLETLLEATEKVLDKVKHEVNEQEYLSLLSTNYDKIKFLRIVKGHTQEETAEILNISVRTVQRI